jgi:hypothetical protein
LIGHCIVFPVFRRLIGHCIVCPVLSRLIGHCIVCPVLRCLIGHCIVCPVLRRLITTLVSSNISYSTVVFNVICFNIYFLYHLFDYNTTLKSNKIIIALNNHFDCGV